MINHIIEAHELIKLLRSNIESVFNKNNRSTIKKHVRDLTRLIDSIDKLAKKAAISYNETQKVKFLSLQRLLNSLKKDAITIRDTLNKKYFFFATFLLSCRSVFNKMNSATYKINLKRRLDNLREKLDPAEKKELLALIMTINKLSESIPKSKMYLISVLRRLYNR